MVGLNNDNDYDDNNDNDVSIILKEFYEKLLSDTKELKPEYSKVIDYYFWDLI